MVATASVINRVAKWLNPWKPTAKQIRMRAARNRVAKMRAHYDAARTTSENAEHWAQADDLSPVSSNSWSVRRMLRRRSRYECANNCYAAGMMLTIANDLIGSGPRLQMLTDDPVANKQIEKKFATWMREVGLAHKLRTAVITKKRDGEVFLRFYSNPAHRFSPVWMDIEIIEADQVTTPTLVPDEQHIDGITYDEWANPESYQILRQHPGNDYGPQDYVPEDVPAEDVIHWFRRDRGGQRRGVPEITPALPLFAMLRRFTLAVIIAAETAADHAAILESTASADEESTDGDLSSLNPFDDIPYTRGMLTAVPFGWKLSQMQAVQPTTTYGMFKAEILNEIARCINVPFNVAAGNSAGYNYSSGRLDHKGYYGSLAIEQSDCELTVLDRLFLAWYSEASLITNADGTPYIPEVDLSDKPFAYAWDPPADIDPVKTATAQLIELQSGATTLQAVFAAKGMDLESAQEQQATALGITIEEFQALLRQKLFGSAASVQPAPGDDPSDPTKMDAKRRKRKRTRARATRSFLHRAFGSKS